MAFKPGDKVVHKSGTVAMTVIYRQGKETEPGEAMYFLGWMDGNQRHNESMYECELRLLGDKDMPANR